MSYDKKPFLYVKVGSRFRPFDWNGDRPVINRFYATMFTVEEKVEIEKTLNLDENKHLEWEWRK